MSAPQLPACPIVTENLKTHQRVHYGATTNHVCTNPASRQDWPGMTQWRTKRTGSRLSHLTSLLSRCVASDNLLEFSGPEHPHRENQIITVPTKDTSGKSKTKNRFKKMAQNCAVHANQTVKALVLEGAPNLSMHKRTLLLSLTGSVSHLKNLVVVNL